MKSSTATAMSLFLLVQAEAFAPMSLSTSPSPLSTPSTTELHGFKTFLKRKLSRFRNKNMEEKLQPNALTKASTTRRNTSTVLDQVGYAKEDEACEERYEFSVPSFPAGSVSSVPTKQKDKTPNLDEHQLTLQGANVMTLDSLNDDGNLDIPYTLPPIGQHKLTKLESEFRDMLIDFSQYTQRDIMAIRNPRLRSIFQGVAASYDLPEVYRAFEVLFEDYVPLRVAGRLIYGKLKVVMVEAQQERQEQVEAVAELTGMSTADIEASRTAYFQMVVHDDDKATEMTIQQIVDYGLAETAVEVLEYESFDEFVKSLNPCEKQKVDFERLMVALQMCPVDNSSPECNPTTVLQEIASRLEYRVCSASFVSKGAEKKKLDERYNKMVERFREWKDLVPAGDGRRLDILRGCFVGANSGEIVGALRIVYMDYSALRVSGDLIFKIMATLVGRK